MDKFLRNAPTISVVVVLLIQLNRVADFGDRIGAGWLAWVYAIFLAFSIYALSYWSGRLHYEITADPNEPKDARKYAQQKRMKAIFDRARFNASLWLILFIGIDGWLNLAETMAALPTDVQSWEMGGAVVYGIFPTLAAFGLGALQSMLDKVPAGPAKKSWFARFADIFLLRMEPQVPADTAQSSQTATQNAEPAKVYECNWPNCDAVFDKPQSYSAHMSHHRRAEAKILAEKELEKVP